MATPLTTVTTQALSSHLAQVFAQYPIEVAHGEGVWLHARDGRKILDFYGGHAVAGLGYGHSRWLAALERQGQAAGDRHVGSDLVRPRRHGGQSTTLLSWLP